MIDFHEEPSPMLVITDAGADQLPLANFDLVIIIEPDPVAYKPLGREIENLGFLLQDIETAFTEEVTSACNLIDAFLPPDDGDETAFVWVRYFDDVLPYFRKIAETIFCRAAFSLMDYDELEHFRCYVQGVAVHHRKWKVAVMGGMLGDDVVRIANLVQEAGLSTTVLTRYCVLYNAFTNLDSLYFYDAWVKYSGGPGNGHTPSRGDDLDEGRLGSVGPPKGDNDS